MLRRTAGLLCAAAGSAGDVATAAAAATPPRPVSPARSWRRLPMHAWQLQISPTEQQPGAEPELYFHGTMLGPCPLMVLGGAGDGGAALVDHAAWLSHCGCRHGALSVPMPTSAAFIAARRTCDGDIDDLPGDGSYVNAQCHAVARAMDVLGLSWTHFVAHSVGALVAAKMAWLYPEKVGTIALLDTPLLTKELCRNEELRAELVAAMVDVNTPAHLIRARQVELQRGLEPLLPRGTVADAALNKLSDEVAANHVFPAAKVFADGGVLRDDVPRFLSAAHIEQIRVPVLLLSPKANPVADANVHKQRLNLRKHQVVAAADGHAALFADGKGGGAAEVGAAIAQWYDRYDMDAMMRRRWEQSIRDIRPKRGGEGVAGAAPAAEGAAGAPKGPPVPGGTKRPPQQDKKKKGGGKSQ